VEFSPRIQAHPYTDSVYKHGGRSITGKTASPWRVRRVSLARPPTLRFHEITSGGTIVIRLTDYEITRESCGVLKAFYYGCFRGPSPAIGNFNRIQSCCNQSIRSPLEIAV
jgi:hypothetical protein